MKIKTSELSGAQLDWAVAHCEELKLSRLSGGEFLLSNGDFWFPSTNWAQGGPIIEREGISLKYEADPHQKWTATWCKIEYKVVRHHTKIVKGPKVEMSASFGTPLVAAMRCYVASKLGDEVEVPEEVCGENI